MLDVAGARRLEHRFDPVTEDILQDIDEVQEGCGARRRPR